LAAQQALRGRAGGLRVADLNYIAARKEIEMSTYDVPKEPDLVVQSRKAAHCTRRRPNGGADDLAARDMEDMIHAAALAYWQHQREGLLAFFRFVCASQSTRKCLYRKILGWNSPNPLCPNAP